MCSKCSIAIKEVSRGGEFIALDSEPCRMSFYCRMKGFVFMKMLFTIVLSWRIEPFDWLPMSELFQKSGFLSLKRTTLLPDKC